MGVKYHGARAKRHLEKQAADAMRLAEVDRELHS